MGERSFAHSRDAGPAEATVRVATTLVNAAPARTMHQERERIGRRRRVVGMALLSKNFWSRRIIRPRRRLDWRTPKKGSCPFFVCQRKHVPGLVDRNAQAQLAKAGAVV